MSEEELKRKAAKLAEKYSKDSSSEDFVHEMNHITMVHNANLGRRLLDAFLLLNTLGEYRLESIFPNLTVSRKELQQA